MNDPLPFGAPPAASGLHSAVSGWLGITAPAMFGRMHVAPLLMDFLALHPRVKARTFFADHMLHLVDEGFDVAIRIAQLPDSGPTAVSVVSGLGRLSSA